MRKDFWIHIPTSGFDSDIIWHEKPDPNRIQFPGEIHVIEVSPEYDKAVEVMREALEESECDCTDANHVTGLMVKDECFRCQALAAFEKAKGVK